jgi:hypothetical protein
MAKKMIEGLNMFTADGRIEGPGSMTLAYRLRGSLGPMEITEAMSTDDDELGEIDLSLVPPGGMPYALAPRKRKPE